MAHAYTKFTNWHIANDDPSVANDPNSVSWGATESDQNFHIRFQFAETAGANLNNAVFAVFYNTQDDINSAVQVTTDGSVNAVYITPSVGGESLSDNLAITSPILTVPAGFSAGDWIDGWYIQASDTFPAKSFSYNYTEYQVCLTFSQNLEYGTTYYFWIKFSDGSNLNEYAMTAPSVHVGMPITTYGRFTDWKILNSTKADISWNYIREKFKNTSWGILSQKTHNTSWHFLDFSSIGTQWRIRNKKEKNSGWGILNTAYIGTNWRIIKRTFDLEWRKDSEESLLGYVYGLEASFYTVEGLEKGQNYQWRVRSVENDIPGLWSSWITFTTTADAGVYRLDTSWKVHNTFLYLYSWRIKDININNTQWFIYNRQEADVSWNIAIVYQLFKELSWGILYGKEIAVGWEISRAIIQRMMLMSNLGVQKICQLIQGFGVSSHQGIIYQIGVFANNFQKVLYDYPRGDCVEKRQKNTIGLLRDIYKIQGNLYIHTEASRILQKIIHTHSRGDYVGKRQKNKIALMRDIHKFQSILYIHTEANVIFQKIFTVISGEPVTNNVAYLQSLLKHNDIIKLQNISYMLKDMELFTYMGGLTESKIAGFVESGQFGSFINLYLYIDGREINNSGKCGNFYMVFHERSVHNSIRIQSNSPELFRWADPNINYGEPRIEVQIVYSITVDGTEQIKQKSIEFIIDARDGEMTAFEISGISVSVKEDAPFAESMDYQLTAPKLASEIAEEISTYCSVTWDTVDWVVPVEFEFSGKPLDGLQLLANEIGAIVRCQEDGSLLVRKRRPVRPIHMDDAAFDFNYDRDFILSLTHLEERETGYNAIEVFGRSLDASIPDMEVEGTPAVGEDCFIRVYWAGKNITVFDRYVTDGDIEIIGNGAFYYRDEEQIVEFKEGIAKVAHPVFSLLGYEWIGDSDALIEWVQHDDSLTIPSRGFRVANVKYRTRYQRYKLFGHNVEHLIAALFLDPGYDVSTKVRTSADPVYGSPIDAPLLTTEEAIIQRGKDWIDAQYRKSNVSIEVPYKFDTFDIYDGKLAYINDAHIGEQGNYHIKGYTLFVEGPKITNQIEVEKCLTFFNY